MLELELHTYIAFTLQTSPSSCYARSSLEKGKVDTRCIVSYCRCSATLKET